MSISGISRLIVVISDNMPGTFKSVGNYCFLHGFSLSDAPSADAPATRSRQGSGTSGTATGATTDGCHTVSTLNFLPFTGNKNEWFILIASNSYAN